MKDDRVQCHLLHGVSKVGKRCELSGLDASLAQSGKKYYCIETAFWSKPRKNVI